MEAFIGIRNPPMQYLISSLGPFAKINQIHFLRYYKNINDNQMSEALWAPGSLRENIYR
jgi:hypothetical protein